MGTKIDELEKSINDLIAESKMEDLDDIEKDASAKKEEDLHKKEENEPANEENI